MSFIIGFVLGMFSQAFYPEPVEKLIDKIKNIAKHLSEECEK